jgi:uncharacterized phiE125 gp8 family phage protein
LATPKKENAMSSILLTGPSVEPLTLAEAKNYLRVEHDDDDAAVGALIAAARIHIETQTRRALITQTWRFIADAWPSDGRLRLSPAPLQQILAARVYELDGTTVTVDTEAFVIDKAAAPPLIAFMPWSLPTPGRDTGGIELDIKVGYGDAAASVPEPLRQAMRLLIAHWYENRGVAAFGSAMTLLPANIGALLAPYRVLSL